MPLTPEQTQECAALKKLFEEKSEISQRAFAKKYELGTPANLGQYLLGRRALNLKIATTIANALGVDISEFSPRLAREIAKFKLEPNAYPTTERMRKIPIISFVQAGRLTDCGQVQSYQFSIDNGDYLLADAELPDGTFALSIEGNSMEPDFLEGDLIIIDPTLTPRPGDFVVVNAESPFSDSASCTFKKYRPRGFDEHGREVFELMPLNPDYPTIYSDRQPCRIVGVMVEHRRKYRRK